MQARQLCKIRELGDALLAAGLRTLDQQAKALGLARSTTWTILKANHKASGLSADVINLMLAAPQLPPLVRAKILEYVEEKAAGLYGHGAMQRRRFAARLSLKESSRARPKPTAKPEAKQQFHLVARTLVTVADEVIERDEPRNPSRPRLRAQVKALHRR